MKCPKCGSENENQDFCDVCFTFFKEMELPKSDESVRDSEPSRDENIEYPPLHADDLTTTSASSPIDKEDFKFSMQDPNENLQITNSPSTSINESSYFKELSPENNSIENQPIQPDYGNNHKEPSFISGSNNEEYSPSPNFLNASEPPSKPDKPLKKTALILVLSLLFLASLGVFAYRNADFILSPKNYYLFIESQNSVLTSKGIAKAYQTFMDSIKEKSTELQISKKVSFSPKFEFTLPQGDQKNSNSGLLSESDIKSAKLLQELVNQSKLTTYFDANAKEHKQLMKVDLSYKNSHIVEFSYLEMENILGFYLPELYKKYIAVDLTKMETLKKTDESVRDFLSQRSIKPADIINALDMDKERVEKIVKRYTNIMIKALPEDKVTLQKNTFVDDEEGGKLPTKEIIIKLDAQVLQKVSLDVCTALADDVTIQDSISNTIKNLIQLYKDKKMSDTSIKELEKGLADFKTNWKKELDSAKQSMSKEPVRSAYTMHLYVDSWGNLLERRIERNASSATAQKPDSNDTSIAVPKDAKNTINEKFVLDFKKLETIKGNFLNTASIDTMLNFFVDIPIKIKITDKYKEDADKNNVGTLSFVVESEGMADKNSAQKNTADNNYVKIFIDYTQSKNFMADAGIPLGDYKLHSEYLVSGIKNPAPIFATLNVKEMPNKAQGFIYDLLLEAKDPMIPVNKLSVGFTAQSEKPAEGEIKYPDLSKEPVVNIADMSEDELKKLGEEIMKNAEDFKASLEKTFPFFATLPGTSLPGAPLTASTWGGSITPQTSSGVIQNSQKKDDEQLAIILEKCVNLLMVDTGSSEFDKMKATKGNKTLDRMSVNEMIEALQDSIELNGKSYGPYLDKVPGYNYEVQWTPANGGQNVGFKIYIDKTLKKGFCKPVTKEEECKITIK